VCKKERHRSVAAKELLARYLLSYEDIIDVRTERIKGDFARLCNEDCPECSWKDSTHSIALEDSVNTFEKKLDKSGGIQVSARRIRDKGMLKTAMPKSRVRRTYQSSEREKVPPKEVVDPPERHKPIDERPPSPPPDERQLIETELDEVVINYVDELRDDAVLRLANQVAAMFRDGEQREIELVSDAIHVAKAVATKHRLNTYFLQRVGLMAKQAMPRPPDPVGRTAERMARPPDAKRKRSKTPERRGRSLARASGCRKDVRRSRSPMKAGKSVQSEVGKRHRSPSKPRRREPPKSEARSSRDAVVLKERETSRLSEVDDQRRGRRDNAGVTHDQWIWETAEINWDPTEVSDHQLSKLFEEKQNIRSKFGHERNFITYLGKDDLRKEMKVRVNCKFHPLGSKISFPPNAKNYKQTTMVRYAGRTTWKVVEERVPAYAFTETSSMAEKVELRCVSAGAEENERRSCLFMRTKFRSRARFLQDWNNE
jgi:hypothetical protein